MTSWSHGYVADSRYLASYQHAQSPAGLALACALMGVEARLGADLALADIGCGRGLTVNVLAAANPRWTVVGIDYHPAHVAEAAALAEDARLPNAVFADADLADLADADLDQLPDFDVVTLHGLWTWVDDAVRRGVVRLLARRLKPGGIAYVGYNALPAFGAEFGMQRLLRHAAAAQRGDSAARVRAAIDTLRALHATRPPQLPATPMLRRLVDADDPLAAAYVAHEFLTAHWRPVFFADLARDLAAAGLDHVGSVALHDNVPELQLQPPQREVWQSLPAAPMRELVLDLCTARRFRRDVFVRGVTRVDAQTALDRVALAAAAPVVDAPPRIAVPAGAAELPAALWRPIAAALAAGARRIGELRALVAPAKPTAAELAVLLTSSGRAVPVLREPRPTDATRRFNAVLAQRLPWHDRSASQPALASPAMGAGLPCDPIDLHVATAVAHAGPDGVDPAALAARLAPHADVQAQSELQALVAALLRDRVPVWRGLGIV